MTGTLDATCAIFSVGFDYTSSDFEQLPRAVSDANRIAAFFQVHGGFEPYPKTGKLARVRASAVIDALATWARELRSRGSVDSFVIYIAGHGEVARGEHFTCTAHTDRSHPITGYSAIRSASVVEEALAAGAPKVLLIFDSCQSGAAVSDLLDAIRRIELFDSSGAPDVVALSACQPYEDAFSGAFVDAMLSAVYEGFGDYIPIERFEHYDVTDLRDELRRRLGDTQSVVSAGIGGRRIIPNPNYVGDLAEQRLDVRLPPRQPLDARHLGGEVDQPSGENYVGRPRCLEYVLQWVRDEKSGILVVTGPAGIGKSAFLSNLGSIFGPADPPNRADHEQSHIVTGHGLAHAKIDAIVSLRNLNPSSAADAIGRQLGMDLSGSPRPERDLVERVRMSDSDILIILDALDEALVGASRAISLDLVRPLSLIGNCRIIVGGRRGEGTAALGVTEHGEDSNPTIATTADFVHVLDLGVLGDDEDVSLYLKRQLESVQFPRRHELVVRTELARVAQGNFLIAETLVHRFIGRWLAAPEDPSLFLRTLLESAILDLESVFETEFDRHPDPIWLKEILRPLAYALGNGLPRRELWAELATSLADSGRIYQTADVAAAIEQAGWYLIEATAGGEAVYRLFHEALASFLRQPLE